MKSDATTQIFGASVSDAISPMWNSTFALKLGSPNTNRHEKGRPRPAWQDELRYQLTQVVEGYIDRCNEDAARAATEWMRQQYRARGEEADVLIAAVVGAASYKCRTVATIHHVSAPPEKMLERRKALPRKNWKS
jgi:hypothetical protein